MSLDSLLQCAPSELLICFKKIIHLRFIPGRTVYRFCDLLPCLSKLTSRVTDKIRTLSVEVRLKPVNKCGCADGCFFNAELLRRCSVSFESAVIYEIAPSNRGFGKVAPLESAITETDPLPHTSFKATALKNTV